MPGPTRISKTVVILMFMLSIMGAVPAQAQSHYILVGNLLDVLSGTSLPDQAIVVEGDRITAVGYRADIVRPEAAEFIDLSDYTVLPGLIDAHVHLTSDAMQGGYQALARSTYRNAFYGVMAARLTVEAGFTTVRNLGAADFSDIALRDAIAAGEFPGPRVVVSGPAFGITGGHCDSNMLPPEYDFSAGGVADGPWAVRTRVRENNKYGVDVIKFCATGGVMSRNTNLNAQQYTDEEMRALVDEAHTLGLKVAAHAHGASGIKAAIRAGVDSVEHASILDDEAIAMAKEAGTMLTMDIYVSNFILEEGEAAGMLAESLEKEREVGALQRASFRKAVQADLNIVFGSDAGVYPHGLNARQFAFMVDNGMTPLQAIQSATTKAAELLGMENDIGRLETGYFADLIAVKESPLDNIRTLEDVVYVMKGGMSITDRVFP